MTRNAQFVTAYQPTLPTFVIIIDRENGHTYTTDAEGERHARMLAESLVDDGTRGAWRATVIDNDAAVVGTYARGEWN